MASSSTSPRRPPRPGRGRPQMKRVLSDIPEPKRKSGLAGATFNLTKAIIGSGIIGIPFTIQQSGLVLGPFLLLLVTYLCIRSLRIIVETASYHPQLKLVNVQTYEDLMYIPFGNAGLQYVLINKGLFAYGCMVAYLLIIKDTIPPILQLTEYRQEVMVVASLLIVLPLSLQRDMASLAFTSIVGVLADVVLVALICYYSPVAESVNKAGGFGTVFTTEAFNSHFFIGLGIISQAMTCQPQAMITYGSLSQKTSHRWTLVSTWSLSIAWVLCALTGIVGFLGFLDQTEGDILNNLQTGSFGADLSRGLIAVSMFFTYPMQAFVARHVLAKIFFNGDTEGTAVTAPATAVTTTTKSDTTIGTAKEDDEVEEEEVVEAKDEEDDNGEGAKTLIEAPTTQPQPPPPKPKPTYWCYCIGRLHILTISIYIATLIPALIFDDLGPVLSITGAIGGSSLAYIAPGLIYLGCHGDYFIQYTNEQMMKRKGGGTTTTTDAAVDLPAEGDSDVKAILPDTTTTAEGRGPWWWCLILMPIWRMIAHNGSEGMKIRLQLLEEERPGCTTTSPTGEIIGPMNSDFYLAIFLILFGIVAMVAGVLSNVLVQVGGWPVW